MGAKCSAPQTFSVQTGGWLAVLEMQLIFGGADARLGIRQRLLTHLVAGVSIVEVVRLLKRTLHRNRRICSPTALLQLNIIIIIIIPSVDMFPREFRN